MTHLADINNVIFVCFSILLDFLCLLTPNIKTFLQRFRIVYEYGSHHFDCLAASSFKKINHPEDQSLLKKEQLFCICSVFHKSMCSIMKRLEKQRIASLKTQPLCSVTAKTIIECFLKTRKKLSHVGLLFRFQICLYI